MTQPRGVTPRGTAASPATSVPSNDDRYVTLLTSTRPSWRPPGGIGWGAEPLRPGTTIATTRTKSATPSARAVRRRGRRRPACAMSVVRPAQRTDRGHAPSARRPHVRLARQPVVDRVGRRLGLLVQHAEVRAGDIG